MTKKSRGFVAVDVLLLCLALLPLVCGMVLKVLTTPSSADIDISGSLIYFTIPMPLQDLPITESQVNSALVSLTILFLCLYLTHGIAAKPTTKRQLLAEWIVEKTDGLIRDNMDPYFKSFSPFIAAIMGL